MIVFDLCVLVKKKMHQDFLKLDDMPGGLGTAFGPG